MPDGMQEKVQEPKEKQRLRERIMNAFRIDESKPEPAVTKLYRSVMLKHSVVISAEGFAIGFPRYLNHIVNFTAFPDILDAVGMGLIGSYLIVDALRPKLNNPIDKLHRAVKLALGSLAMSLTLSFPESFDHYALFQMVPNELYPIVMGTITAYLFADIVKDLRRRVKAQESDQANASNPLPLCVR